MAIGWYLTVSAMIFCIGAGGVLARRNPLTILLCLELMLNGANLALIAFARMWGGESGQVFALIVMVVAAVGAIVLARRRGGLEDETPSGPPIRVRAPRPAYTGTIAEAAGVRPSARDVAEDPPLPEVETAPIQGGW